MTMLSPGRIQRPGPSWGCEGAGGIAKDCGFEGTLVATGTGVSSWTYRLGAEGAIAGEVAVGATAGGVRTGVGAETGWSSGTNLAVVAIGGA